MAKVGEGILARLESSMRQSGFSSLLAMSELTDAELIRLPGVGKKSLEVLRAQFPAKEIDGAARATAGELVAFLHLYEKVYMRTQTNPSRADEAMVIVKAQLLLNKLHES